MIQWLKQNTAKSFKKRIKNALSELKKQTPYEVKIGAFLYLFSSAGETVTRK